jgi:hypothetical protein
MDLGLVFGNNQLLRFLPEAPHFKLMADVAITPDPGPRRYHVRQKSYDAVRRSEMSIPALRLLRAREVVR